MVEGQEERQRGWEGHPQRESYVRLGCESGAAPLTINCPVHVFCTSNIRWITDTAEYEKANAKYVLQ